MVACNPLYVWGVPRQTGFTSPRPKSISVAILRVAIKSSPKTYSFRLSPLGYRVMYFYNNIWLKRTSNICLEIEWNKPKPVFKKSLKIKIIMEIENGISLLSRK